MTDDPEFSGVEIVTTFVFSLLLAWFYIVLQGQNLSIDVQMSS